MMIIGFGAVGSMLRRRRGLRGSALTELPLAGDRG
jgi:hypothetical protein